jgi:hypothetical protein
MRRREEAGAVVHSTAERIQTLALQLDKKPG